MNEDEEFDIVHPPPPMTHTTVLVCVRSGGPSPHHCQCTF